MMVALTNRQTLAERLAPRLLKDTMDGSIFGCPVPGALLLWSLGACLGSFWVVR